ncbi:hypothetical protein RRV45_11390 [Bacillus sp. DTU_2020_1000418_1_SI_GHA_SEK_038]|uniref:hypothetical protein n=1 Tax=Bacillus sp. DTU_2020_1000418_1_SI_GHA_SEK_038 TaxID=3077585 RepID=UPI0028E68D4B|nr:hypothetical protein [Bacillus sp. DTU_2020_1000418_1_SI_GHA_SEK_038]WNS73531.1 hypothetical protein RRV45_11390 [Bacillus sp. DTU_2020_1000418_1_SI_GHA_SEK_038]
MEQENRVPDFSQMDHTVNSAYTTESIVTNSNLDLNISTEEQNTVEIKNTKNFFAD